MRDIDVNNVKNVYNSLAVTWDDKSSLISAIKGGNSNRTLSLLKSLVKPNMNIADLGSGTGRATRNILKINKNVNIYCADLSTCMMNILLDKVHTEFPSYKRLHTYCDDVNNATFNGTKMDLIVMLYLLHHVKNVNKTLKHVVNMLSPNGKVLIQVPGIGEFSDEIKPDIHSHYIDPMGRFTLKELVSEARKVGLVPIKEYKDEFDFIFKNNNDFEEFIKENSVLAKISNYKSLNIKKYKFDGLKRGHGQYLTVLFEKSNQALLENQKNKIAYENWSDCYTRYALEKLNHRGYSYDELAEAISAKMIHNGTTLDIGAGTGLVDTRIRQLNTKSDIFGVDLSPDMYKDNICKNIYNGFYVGDATAVPFKNNYFDNIISTFMLHHCSSIDSIFNKIYSMLKVGGRFIFVDFIIKSKNRDNFDAAYQSSREYGAIANEQTIKSLYDQLKLNGFSDIDIKYLGEDRDLPHVLFAAKK